MGGEPSFEESVQLRRLHTEHLDSSKIVCLIPNCYRLFSSVDRYTDHYIDCKAELIGVNREKLLEKSEIRSRTKRQLLSDIMMFYGGHSTRKEWDQTRFAANYEDNESKLKRELPSLENMEEEFGVTPQLIVDEISEMVKNSGAVNIPWKNWFINCDTV